MPTFREPHFSRLVVQESKLSVCLTRSRTESPATRRSIPRPATRTPSRPFSRTLSLPSRTRAKWRCRSMVRRVWSARAATTLVDRFSPSLQLLSSASRCRRVCGSSWWYVFLFRRRLCPRCDQLILCPLAGRLSARRLSRRHCLLDASPPFAARDAVGSRAVVRRERRRQRRRRAERRRDKRRSWQARSRERQARRILGRRSRGRCKLFKVGVAQGQTQQ